MSLMENDTIIAQEPTTNVGDRVIIWEEPEYTASYHVQDIGNGEVMTFFHLDVFYMSAQILRRLEEQWKLFRQCVPCVLFTMCDEESPAWIKLCERFGFKILRPVECTDGKTRTLLVHYGPTQEAQK